ncbi:MAG: cupin [Bacteroidetes bacterium]|nr:MAG: cupin [Bacteroidota bacterium]
MSQLKKLSEKLNVSLLARDLTAYIDYFTGLGFRLDNIYPDDDPKVAIMSGNNIQIRIDKGIGKEVKLTELPNSDEVIFPPTEHKFEVRKLQDNDPWIIGRAGMLYRDLLPDRLGGSIIASHIRIPVGGPVPDMVHYHTIGFQLIFCYRGWVKLVYEDQGPAFILNAGDCVTQPPQIRHRVLEASDNLEVIEIGVPADHMTTIDHDMNLPTSEYLPDREFQGQKFCHHQVDEAQWNLWKMQGFEFRDTGIEIATAGMVSVHVARVLENTKKTQTITHDADILFTFIMEGEMMLGADDREPIQLRNGEAFVIPPNFKYQLINWTEDLELLEVSLPGNYNTQTL